jgi:putative ABC transport system permease protein
MRMIFDIFGQTMRTLWAHKLRSFLTMFGIAWGVGSLLLLVGVGEGFRSGNREELSTLGENVMFIFDGRAPMLNGSFTSMQQYYLTDKDYRDVQAECSQVGLVAPIIQRSDLHAVSEFYQSSGEVMGTTPVYDKIRYTPIAEGRWIDDLDGAQGRQVVVLGDESKKVLFPGRPAVGSTLLLNGESFQVIGTIARIGHGNDMGDNTRIIVPYQTMMQHFPPLKVGEAVNAISYLNYQPTTRDQHAAAQDCVHKIVARNHNFDYRDPNSFNGFDTVLMSDQIGKIFTAMDVFLGSVGLVTLMLGAIGIINIMLVAVADRTREIGLRKAIGATNRSIMFQFFVEGAFLTLLSGCIGMGAAAAVMAGLAKLPQQPGFSTPRLVPLTAALAIVSLAAAGTIAGLYPAKRAAELTPVDALRRE